MAIVARTFLAIVMLITGLLGSALPASGVGTTSSSSVSVEASGPDSVIDAAGTPVVNLGGFIARAPAAAAIRTIAPTVDGIGEGIEEEPPEPQSRIIPSGRTTGFEYFDAGFMGYSQNQVPFTDPATGQATKTPGDRGISGWGPKACDSANPAFYTSGDGNTNAGCGFGAQSPPRCYLAFQGPSPTSPYSNWSYGSSWRVDALYSIDLVQESLDGGETWVTLREQRGAPVGYFRVDWGPCQFYGGPVSTMISCLTRIGPVTFEGPLQSKGLPAKDFRAGRWVTIPESEYQSPKTIKNANGSAWTFTTPIGQLFTTAGGKLRGYGEIPGSLNLVDACQGIDMPLPENLEVQGWGNYKFTMDKQWIKCEIVNDPGFGTRNFQGCERQAPVTGDPQWAYKLCNEPLVWSADGRPLRGPNTQINFDPTACDPEPDCMWTSSRTGETKGGRGIPDRYVTSESGVETLVLAGSGTDADSSVMVAADGRPVRVDVPELTMSIPGGRGSSTYCPEGTQRIDANTCRVFADYTYSTVWRIVRYNPVWVDTSYYVDTSRWERRHVGNEPIWQLQMVYRGQCMYYWWAGACICPGGMAQSGSGCYGPGHVLVGWRPIYQNVWVQSGYWVRQGYTRYDPVYGWVTERDPAPAGYSDNGSQWFKDIDSVDNTSNTRYTVWEVRRGSTPWAPGGVMRNSNPNAGDQPFSSHAAGASGVLSMTSDGVEKFATSTDGYPFDAEEMAKDPTKGDASRPLSVNGGSQWALDLELNFYEPAADYSDVMNENRFVVRGHFQQLWNEEFTLNSVSKFKTMYTPSGSVPYIGIIEGPTRTERFEITETCSTAEQNFTVVGTRNSPN